MDRYCRVIWPCNASRNEHVGKKQKCASQHTRLFAANNRNKRKVEQERRTDKKKPTIGKKDLPTMHRFDHTTRCELTRREEIIYGIFPR